MTEPKTAGLSFVHFAADAWGHVCPVVRVTGPADADGIPWVKGNDWDGPDLFTYPERIAASDFVLIQRDFSRHREAYLEVTRLAHQHHKKVVYELDDLLLELPEDHPDFDHYAGIRHFILEAAVEADAVTCTTPAIAEVLRAYNPAVYVLPNYLNDRIWSFKDPLQRERQPGQPVVIGYLGGHSHLPDLESIAPALVRVLQRYGQGVQFKFWGCPPPAEIRGWPNVSFEIPGLVDYAAFADFFSRQDCDLFLAPLRDNLFNRCKSPLKFIEYGAMGIPAVYSDLSPYAGLVQDGVDGFLAGGVEAWTERLVQLIDSSALRAEMGRAAQTTVREHWLLSAHAGEWRAAYQSILAQPFSGVDPQGVTQAIQTTLRWQGALERRLSEKDQAILAVQHQIEEEQAQIKLLETDLKGIKSGAGWSALQAAHRLASKLAPAGSLRQRVLKGGLRRVLRLRRGSPAAVVPGLEQPLLNVTRRRGTPPQQPLVSIVWMQGVGLPALNAAVLEEWAAHQTLPGLEIVRWQRDTAQASVTGGGREPWQAGDYRALAAGLAGKYICFASHDLLRQRPTYLEANLMALEGEGLAFTVNALGRPDVVLAALERGLLPGTPEFPALRQVLRTDCLGPDGQPDLAAFLAARGNQPVPAGKLIVHTTAAADLPNTLPFELRLPELDYHMVDRTLAVRSSANGPWPVMAQTVYEVDSVLPQEPIPSDLPTVIVVLQFFAVGGAERLVINLIRSLQDSIRFVVVALEAGDLALGTTADAFHDLTPYVYSAADFLPASSTLSFFDHLVKRYGAHTLYIANGTNWLYDHISEIKQRYPSLRMVNQVYDHQAGWINRYHAGFVRDVEVHISANPKITQAYEERGVKPRQVSFIEHGIDLSEADPAHYDAARLRAVRQKLGLPLEKRLVTFAARLHPQKRPMDFVELARQFADQSDVFFLMVGDGSLAEAVDGTTIKIGLKNFARISFYSPISDIYAISDVMVLPSEYEAIPLVLLESQAMGVPMVVTDVGGVRGVIEMTGGGVVVDQIGNVTGLRAGVTRALETQYDRTAMRQAIEDRFGITRIAEDYRRALLGEDHA